MLQWFLLVVPSSCLAYSNEVYFDDDIPEKCHGQVTIGTNQATWCNITEFWKPHFFGDALLFVIYVPIVTNFAVVFVFAWMCKFKAIAEKSRMKYLRYLKFIEVNHEIEFKKVGSLQFAPPSFGQGKLRACKWFWGP